MNTSHRSLFIAGLSGVFVFAFSPLSAAPPVQAPIVDITSSGARVRGGPTMDERITKLESVLENNTLEDFASRIGALQQELQKLQGEAETMNHGIEDLKRKQRELYLDLDRRLRVLETKSSNALGADAGGNGGVAPSAEERAAYDTAFATLRDGKYEEAIVGLQDFLKRYPASEFADNAQYWLAEANFVQHRYDVALIEFERVVTKYPDSTKYSDALLKYGLTHYELGAWDKSSQALTDVVKKFPNTTQAQIATQRLEKLKLEGH